MRCTKCNGTKRIMGMGMIYKDCDCTDIPKAVTLDRRSKAYKEAIDKIMQTNDCSREDAIDVFDSEFDKIA